MLRYPPGPPTIRTHTHTHTQFCNLRRTSCWCWQPPTALHTPASGAGAVQQQLRLQQGGVPSSDTAVGGMLITAPAGHLQLHWAGGVACGSCCMHEGQGGRSPLIAAA